MDQLRSAPTTTILSIPVDHITQAAAVEAVGAMIARGEPRQLVTLNPEFVMLAQRHREFRQVLQQADLRLADGVGLIWAARWLRRPLPGRVTGVGLCEALASSAAQRGWRLFLLGAAPGVAAAAGAALERRYPGVQIVGCWAGSPQPTAAAEILALVNAAQPDILLVAYGAPAQDLWIATHRAAISAPVALGVGGTFDFLAGRVPRAPLWMQRAGLEWLFRLARQPWRWRRMLALPRFVVAVVRGGR